MTGDATRFGVVLQGVEAPESFAEQVRFIETSGFSHLWVTDSSLHARYVYSYLTLAALSSDRIQLGTGITHPFTRHPALTANAIATLDEISKGRAILGLGAGDRPTAELGFKPASLKILRETISVIRRLMAGETIDFEGAAFRLSGAKLHFECRPQLPIYMACTGPRMLALAGELADGIIVQCGLFPAAITFALDQIRAGASKSGRAIQDIDIWVLACGALDEDRQSGLDQSRTMAAWFANTAPQYCAMADLDPDLIGEIQRRYAGGEFHLAKEAAALVPDEMVAKFTLGGSPSDAEARLSRLREAGCDAFTFMPIGKNRDRSLGLFRELMG